MDPHSVDAGQIGAFDGRGPLRDRCAVDPEGYDGPRYAGIGDAVTAPVGAWIGRRLVEFGG
jgi:hypothetical protein